ncbi:MAG: hypothetical protein V4547_17285 [Bacteroidota bacterium]
MLKKIKSFAYDNYKAITAFALVLTSLSVSGHSAHAAGVDDLVSDADDGFTSTTGFSIADVVTWSATNLIKLFIGSGLALLYNLRYWIVGLVIIAAIVYFSYRAFRFFRH